MQPQLYRIGLNPDAPLHSVTAGGLNFVPHTFAVALNGDGETERSKVRGSIVETTPEQLQRALESASHKHARSTKGASARTWLVDDRLKYHRPHLSDTCVAQWLYAEPVGPEAAPLVEVTRPSLAETLGKVAKPKAKRKRGRPRKTAAPAVKVEAEPQATKAG